MMRYLHEAAAGLAQVLHRQWSSVYDEKQSRAKQSTRGQKRRGKYRIRKSHLVVLGSDIEIVITVSLELYSE